MRRPEKKNELDQGKFTIYYMILNIPICILGAVTCPHISVVRGFPGHKARACLVNGRCCHGYSASSWRSGNPAWAGVGREQVHRVPNLAQYWGTCDTSSNKDMVLPGDLWDWPNLEPQVPGRGSLRLHKLDRPPNSIPVFFLKSSSLAHSPAPSGS